MVNFVKNDPFLSHVSKLGGKLKEQRIIRLTIKRGISIYDVDLVSRYPELRKSLRHKKRDELLQTIRQNQETETEPVPVLIRVHQNNEQSERVST